MIRARLPEARLAHLLDVDMDRLLRGGARSMRAVCGERPGAPGWRSAPLELKVCARCMQGPPPTLREVVSALRLLRVTLRRVAETGEYRVNFHGGGERTAYYTDDLGDALETGRRMAEERDRKR